MKLVILESPYAGDIARNIEYARRCMRDCIDRGEAPIASHLLYTQQGILDDKVETERILGIHMGLLWAQKADYAIFYTDLGMSTGMKQAVERYDQTGLLYEFRRIGGAS